MITLGEKLNDLRMELWTRELRAGGTRTSTLEKIGRATGMSASIISSYERNEKKASFANVASLAQFYNVSLDLFAGLSNEPVNMETHIIQRKTGL